jgi:hypothetical protein
VVEGVAGEVRMKSSNCDGITSSDLLARLQGPCWLSLNSCQHVMLYIPRYQRKLNGSQRMGMFVPDCQQSLATPLSCAQGKA